MDQIPGGFYQFMMEIRQLEYIIYARCLATQINSRRANNPANLDTRLSEWCREKEGLLAIITHLSLPNTPAILIKKTE
jgi:hypothetical protein